MYARTWTEGSGEIERQRRAYGEAAQRLDGVLLDLDEVAACVRSRRIIVLRPLQLLGSRQFRSGRINNDEVCRPPVPGTTCPSCPSLPTSSKRVFPGLHWRRTQPKLVPSPHATRVTSRPHGFDMRKTGSFDGSCSSRVMGSNTSTSPPNRSRDGAQPDVSP